MNATTICSKCGQHVYATIGGTLANDRSGQYRSEATEQLSCPNGGQHDGDATTLPDHGPFREVHVIRDEFQVVDDGHGGSVDVDHDITVEVFPVRHSVVDMSAFGGVGVEVCTVVREAAGIISSDHYLTFPEGDETPWATTDTFSDPYGRGELDTTAHLYGFTPAEHRAIVRLVRWLDRHEAATTSDRALLFGGCEH